MLSKTKLVINPSTKVTFSRISSPSPSSVVVIIDTVLKHVIGYKVLLVNS